MDITDVFGNYVQRDQRNDNAYHNKGYTGHEYDDTTNLIYAHARFLDTTAHTFLSVDPMIYKVPESYLYDPQQMNSYSYARNNPIVYSDPTGLSIGSFFSSIGSAISNAVTSIGNFFSGSSNTSTTNTKKPQDVINQSTLPNQTQTSTSKNTTNSSNSVLSSSAWQTQMPDKTACFSTCGQMIGYTPNPANRINTASYDANGKLNTSSAAKQGVATIDSYLGNGNPIMVGVNYLPGKESPYNANKATQHFVVISGEGYDNGRKYYNFFDPATSRKEAGTSLMNRLYLNTEDYSLSGVTQYNGSTYSVTEVRPK